MARIMTAIVQCRIRENIVNCRRCAITIAGVRRLHFKFRALDPAALATQDKFRGGDARHGADSRRGAEQGIARDGAAMLGAEINLATVMLSQRVRVNADVLRDARLRDVVQGERYCELARRRCRLMFVPSALNHFSTPARKQGRRNICRLSAWWQVTSGLSFRYT
jgi:hypothetical protein